MYVYIFLYLLILLSVCYINRYNIPQINKGLFLVCAVAIILIVSLRHPSMGVDLQYGKYEGYLGAYLDLAKHTWKFFFAFEPYRNFETGYLFFNKLVASISGTNIQVFLTFCAIVSMVPIFRLIYEESVYPLISLIIYLGLPTFMIVFSTLRQAMAVSICFASVEFIKRKKLVPFLLLVLLATSFHYSAFLFIVSYPLYNIKLDKKHRCCSIGIIVIVYLVKARLFSLLSVLLKKDAVMDNNGAFVLFATFFLIYIFGSFVIKEKDEGFLNLFFIACCVQALAGVFTTATRVGYYFMPFLTILIPNIIDTVENFRVRRLLKVFVPICFIVFGLYSIYSTTWSMAYPYIFFWSK